jgi:hypothetical protein
VTDTIAFLAKQISAAQTGVGNYDIRTFGSPDKG